MQIMAETKAVSEEIGAPVQTDPEDSEYFDRIVRLKSKVSDGQEELIVSKTN